MYNEKPYSHINQVNTQTNQLSNHIQQLNNDHPPNNYTSIIAFLRLLLFKNKIKYRIKNMKYSIQNV